MNNSKNQTHILIACIIFISAMSAFAGDIIVNIVPGGDPSSIVFTDDSGKVIKKLSTVNSVEKSQITTVTGEKLERSIQLMGNSNFALMAEYTAPADRSFGDYKIPVVVRLYNKKADELFALRGYDINLKALTETGVSVFKESPPELWTGPEDGFDVLTVYDKAGTKLFEHKEYPYTIMSIQISLNAKWLVFYVRPSPHKPSRFRNLVRVNLETQQVYTESVKSSDPVFGRHEIRNDGSITRTTDFKGPVLPDGSRKKIKKTHILREGIRQ